MTRTENASGILIRIEQESLMYLMKRLNTTWYSTSKRAPFERACEWPEIGCECNEENACRISFVSFYGLDLVGELPRAGLPHKLERVKIFDVGNNRLKGIVSNAFVRSFPNLQTLKLGVNNLEGIIPYELGNLKWLEEIDLDGGFTQKQIYYDVGFPEERRISMASPGRILGTSLSDKFLSRFDFYVV